MGLRQRPRLHLWWQLGAERLADDLMMSVVAEASGWAEGLAVEAAGAAGLADDAVVALVCGAAVPPG